MPRDPQRPVVEAAAQNRESARTLDYLSRAPRGSDSDPSLLPSERPLLWPPIGWKLHLAVAGAIVVIALLAFSNSFHAGMTLDNKYIIEYDPRTKTSANLFKPATWDDGPGHTGWLNIWTKDYWWPKGISGLYRPVVTFTYWINWYLLGGDATHTVGFHIVNLAAHCITAYLVFLLCLLFMRRFWPAAAAAILFTVHPVTVESVTNIIGRADIFAAISVLGGLLLYVRSAASEGWRKIPWLVALAALTTVGLFSKESAITVLAVVVLYDLMYRWTPKENPLPVPLLACLCAFIIAAASTISIVCIIAALASPEWTSYRFGITFICVALVMIELAIAIAAVFWLSANKMGWKWLRPWGKYVLPYLAIIIPVVGMFLARNAIFAATTPPEEPFLDNPIRGVSWVAGRLTAFGVTVRLWGVLLWPIHLTADYSFNQVPVFGRFSSPGNDAFAIFAFVLVMAVFALSIWLWLTKRNRAVAFFILFFFATYLLTSNIAYTIGAIMAERFMYLPLVGFVACAALALEWIARKIAARVPVANPEDRNLARLGIASVLAGLIAAGYGVRSFLRNYDWRSDVALWAAAQPESPNSFRSYQSYAFALFEEQAKPKDQRDPAAKDVTIDDAIRVAEKARPIVDQLPDNLNSSRLYLHLGMYYSIKADKLVDAATPNAAANGQVIVTLPEARAYLEKAVAALERGVPIDRAFSVQNRQKEIQRGKNPDDIPPAGLLQVYENLGNVYLRLDRPDKAMEAFRYMRALDPGNADAYLKIAMTYMALNTPRYIGANPQGAANNAEQACIALLQTLWLDPSRAGLWQPLDGLTRQLSPETKPAVVMVGGVPKLDLTQQQARNLLYAMYKSFIQIFLESNATDAAASFRQAAIDSGFPQALFDDLYKAVGRKPPPYVPPPPKPVQPPAAAPMGAKS